jgi:rapamycin-insensitive companion of mTOR
VAQEPKEVAQAAERPYETLKLTDQYIALLILVFSNAGLLDVGPSLYRVLFFS